MGTEAEVKTGEEVVAAAAEQTNTGIEAEAVDGQQTATPDAGETQEVVETDEVHGLKAAAAAERQKRQAAEAQVAALTQQQTQAAQAPQQAQQTATQTDLYQRVLQHHGLQDEPYLTTEQTGQVMRTMDTVRQAEAAQQQFRSSTPDFADVVGYVTPQGAPVMSPHLQAFLSKNPHLQQAALSNEQVAYQLVSTDPDYLAAKAAAVAPVVPVVPTTVPVNKGQVSISAAPGGGAIDKSAHYRGMTPAELQAKIAEAKAAV